MVASERKDEQMGTRESVASERENGAVSVLNLVHTKRCIQRYPQQHQQQQQSTRVSRENQFSCVSERRSCICCVMRALSGDDAHSCLEPWCSFAPNRYQQGQEKTGRE